MLIPCVLSIPYKGRKKNRDRENFDSDFSVEIYSLGQKMWFTQNVCVDVFIARDRPIDRF